MAKIKAATAHQTGQNPRPIRGLLVACLLWTSGMALSLSGCESDESDPNCPGQCFDLESFRVIAVEQGGRLAQLRVSHVEAPEKLLWETTLDTPWLVASRGEEQVEEDRGAFRFEDEILETCAEPSLSRIDSTPQQLAVHGGFRDCSLGFILRLESPLPNQLRFQVELTDNPKSFNRIRMAWVSDPEEGFFGFGNQYDTLNMKGRKLPIWSQEQGHGRGLEPLTSTLNSIAPGSAGEWHTSYTAVPSYLTSQGRGLVVENTEYLEFDLTHPERVEVQVYAGQLGARILYGSNPLELLDALSGYTGRMPPLPNWTQKGPIIRSYGGSEAALARVAALKEIGCPVAALWIEDWAGQRQTPFGTRMWWNWTVDRTMYPDWEDLIETLREQDVRVLAYFNPFLSDAAEKPGVERNLFAEAEASSFLVQTPEGETFMTEMGGFEAAMIDLTNPEARNFIKGIMVEQMEAGVSGWMADFAEALPYDAVLDSGIDARSYHNEYPLAWAELNRQAAQEAGVDADFLFFSRSGNARSPGVARLFWIGDQLVSWDAYDGLQSVIPGLVSSGLSGYTLQHSDTGGWLSIDLAGLGISFKRSKELFMRWLELNTFTPVIRLHSTNLPEKNHQYDTDAETFEHFTRFSRIFASLTSYRQTLMEQASEAGAPLLRHPLIHYPDDPEVYELTQQFMLGSEFMVAPVVEEGATSRRLYLPAGRWTHVWSGQQHGEEDSGSWIEVDAPMGSPPVFYRAESSVGAAFTEELDRQGLR